jgi:hypothetical protein
MNGGARWLRFLEEGGLDKESGWRVEVLSPEQAERFRGFRVKEFGPEQYRCCLQSLELVVRGSGSSE